MRSIRNKKKKKKKKDAPDFDHSHSTASASAPDQGWWWEMELTDSLLFLFLLLNDFLQKKKKGDEVGKKMTECYKVAVVYFIFFCRLHWYAILHLSKGAPGVPDRAPAGTTRKYFLHQPKSFPWLAVKHTANTVPAHSLSLLVSRTVPSGRTKVKTFFFFLLFLPSQFSVS